MKRSGSSLALALLALGVVCLQAAEPAAPAARAGEPAPREDRRSRERAPRTPAPSAGSEAVARNPLERFLSSWMTPRDHALLRKPQTDALTLPAMPGVSSLRSKSRTETVVAGSTAAEPTAANPYLSGLQQAQPSRAEAVNSGPVGTAPESPADGPEPAPAATMLAPEPEAPRAPARYEPPAQTDEKYFPQLKRF